MVSLIRISNCSVRMRINIYMHAPAGWRHKYYCSPYSHKTGHATELGKAQRNGRRAAPAPVLVSLLIRLSWPSALNLIQCDINAHAARAPAPASMMRQPRYQMITGRGSYDTSKGRSGRQVYQYTKTTPMGADQKARNVTSDFPQPLGRFDLPLGCAGRAYRNHVHHTLEGNGAIPTRALPGRRCAFPLECGQITETAVAWAICIQWQWVLTDPPMADGVVLGRSPIMCAS